MKGRVGRETKLTPRLQATLVAVIRRGNYLHVAAEAVGIATGTFHRWMEQGLSDPDEHPEWERCREFRDAVTRAERQAETALVSNWKAQATKDWRAARDLLARRHPERWMPKQQHELTGKGGGPISVSLLDEIMAGDDAAGGPAGDASDPDS